MSDGMDPTWSDIHGSHPTSESVPVLSALTPEELRKLRAEAEAEQGHPGKHGQWERLVLRLLATIDAAPLDVERLYQAMCALDNDNPTVFEIVAISEPDTRPVAEALADYYAALTSEAHRG